MSELIEVIAKKKEIDSKKTSQLFMCFHYILHQNVKYFGNLSFFNQKNLSQLIHKLSLLFFLFFCLSSCLWYNSNAEDLYTFKGQSLSKR